LSVVQSSTSGLGSGTSVSDSFDSNVTAGSTLVAIALLAPNSVNITGISDDVNGAYTAIGTQEDGTAFTGQAYRFEGAASGATEVTASFSGSTAAVVLFIIELPDGVELDDFAYDTGSGTSASTGNMTTSEDNVDIVAGFSAGDATVSIEAGSGFTEIEAVTIVGDAVICEHDDTNSTGSNAATATLSGSTTWLAIGAAFKAAAVGGGGGARYGLTTLGVG